MHPMAIGDVVLGSPVAAAFKLVYPGAKVIYFTHGSLHPLLQLCHAIDECVDWQRKAPLLSQVAMIKKLQPDLIVDLTSSTRTRLLCFLSGVRTIGYQKQNKSERPVAHVTDRYLDVLNSLKLDPPAARPGFPTLRPGETLLNEVRRMLGGGGATDQPLIALIPGVGSLRPNRSWPSHHWVKLISELRDRQLGRLVLVGGPDDEELCRQVEAGIGQQSCQNFAGKLSLPQTAALLKLCDVAISGDTGPCHIAVGVGTPVVSMMGPTLSQRSGPYGCLPLGFDVSDSCKCTASKTCTVRGFPKSGACMEEIAPSAVLQNVERVLQGCATTAST